MRKVIVAALVAGSVAAPAAVLAANTGSQKPAEPVVSLFIRGIAAEDATQGSLKVTPWPNKSNFHARRAIGNLTQITVPLVSATRLRGFITLPNGKRRMVKETYEDIKAGDRVVLKVRAYRSMSALSLPPAKWVKDYTAQVRPAG